MIQSAVIWATKIGKMKAVMLSLGLLALVALGECYSFGDGYNRHLLQESPNTARATSMSTAISSGPDSRSQSGATAESMGGVSEAIAFASSETQEEVENIIIDVFKKVSDEADLDDCDDIITKARVEVEAQSKAVATAYSVTFGEVRVDGEGNACADASASASTEAATFVDVITKAVAEQPNAKATADSSARVISAAVVSAFTEAFSETCTTGGFGQAQQESFAQAIAVPMVQVVVEAIAGSKCGEEVAALSESTADGSSSVDDTVTATTTGTTIAEGDTTATAGGDAGAGVDQVTDLDEITAIEIEAVEDRCQVEFTTCCNRSFDDKDRCRCTLSTNERFFRCDAKKLSSSETSKVVWEDEDGFRCFCN